VVVVLGLAALLVALVLVGAVRVQLTQANGDPERVTEEFGVRGGKAWRWTPPLAAGSGIALALKEQNGKPCILYQGPGYGGGECFGNG
jgi:hypothetical protein